jgi:thiol-disulfide isomerase/thioredoxin
LVGFEARKEVTTMAFALLLALVTQAPEPLSDRFETIAAKSRELEHDYRRTIEAAQQDEEKIIGAGRAHRMKLKLLMQSLKDLVKEHRDDPAALDGLILLVTTMPMSLDEEMVAVAMEHADDDRVGRLCGLVMGLDDVWSSELLERVQEKSRRREIRGQAAYFGGVTFYARALHTDRKLSREQIDELLGRARACYDEVKDRYGDVKAAEGGGTLGERAARELTRLDNLPSLVVGGMAPEIHGEDLHGNPLRLSDYRGKVVALVFWGTWCKPCMEMVPHERDLYDRLRGRPFALLGVNGAETRDSAARTAADRGMAWPSWHDGEDSPGPIAAAYDVTGWPAVYVIDVGGRIRYINVRGKELDEAVDMLLSEAGTK